MGHSIRSIFMISRFIEKKNRPLLAYLIKSSHKGIASAKRSRNNLNSNTDCYNAYNGEYFCPEGPK